MWVFFLDGTLGVGCKDAKIKDPIANTPVFEAHRTALWTNESNTILRLAQGSELTDAQHEERARAEQAEAWVDHDMCP